MFRAIAIVLAAALASACGQATGSGTPSSEPSPSRSPVASLATPTASPSPTPEVTDGRSAPSFERAMTVQGGAERAMNVHGEAELYAITAFEGGFVAGGCRLRPPSSDGSESGCASAYLLHSQDGSFWSELPPPDAADAFIVGISDTPLGVLAFGSSTRSEPPQTRMIWRLVADERWESFAMPAPSSIVFRMAALVNGRTVFLGYDTADDFSTDTEAWTTADGVTWTNGTTPLSPKVPAAPGLVAAGSECVDVCEPSDLLTRVSRSTDAITWTEAAVPPELAATSVESLAAWNGRAILGGSVAGSSASEAVLWLDDAAGWRQVALEDGAGYAVSNVIVAEQGVIAVGRSLADDPQATWWSTDGLAWSRVPLEGVGLGYVGASAAGGRLVVIVNYDSIWVSAF